MPTKSREKIPISTQVEIFFRDDWMCHYCGLPTVFAPALKYMQQDVVTRGLGYTPAYYDFRYAHIAAPLLDELAAVIDHKQAFSAGGTNETTNLVTACNNCNMRKNNRSNDEFENRDCARRAKKRKRKAKGWDGFVSFFVLHGRANPNSLTAQEKEWFVALENYLREQAHP